jgi:hypothetical protein
MLRTHPLILSLVIVCSSLAPAQTVISAVEAKNHIGENRTVCGDVVSAHHAARTRGNPTFLNLDKPYPTQVFTVLIWGTDRSRFGVPEESFANKRICVTGKISSYRGVPEIVAQEPSQIGVQ